MKALLRKEYYILGGRTAILTAVVLAVPALLLNWSFNLVMLAIILCVLPFALDTKDINARWWTYAKTLPYSRDQIVDAKYLFHLVMILLFGLVMLTERFISWLINPERMLNAVFAEYLFFAVCLMSAFIFPSIFRKKRHGSGWLTTAALTVLLLTVSMALCTVLPGLLLQCCDIAYPHSDTEPLRMIGSFSGSDLRQIGRIAKWIVPPFSLALYGLSWRLSRRIFRRKYDRRPPKEYSPVRIGQQDDEDAVLIAQTMFWN